MIINEGKFKDMISLDGFVKFKIDKMVTQSWVFILKFEYLEDIKHSYRKHSKEYSTKIINKSLRIDLNNSDEANSFKENDDIIGFYKFMVDHIKDYFNESTIVESIDDDKSNIIQVDSLKDFLNLIDIDSNLVNLGYNTEESKIGYLLRRTYDAYKKKENKSTFKLKTSKAFDR